jgi:hypothetical protein
MLTVMGRGRLRTWRPLGAAAVIAVIAGWLLYLLYRSHNRDSVSTYGAFAWPVVILAATGLGWAWRKARASQSAAPPGGEALDHAAGQLAAAVAAQWEKAAGERGLTGADPVRVTYGRPSQAMADPATAATASHRFDPLPGLAEAGSRNASDLHTLYGGLRSGRLIIAGPPGSGKTGAAVLLVLAALRHRDQVTPQQRPRVPVPVLFTAQDWNPASDPAARWLTRKLQGTYPLFGGGAGAATAAALLASGRITVILDGLDEISPQLRPLALQALSQQATFRLILLSRTAEMAAAAGQGDLHGAAAVELRPVSPGDAARYLQRVQLDPPPPGWQELTQRIRTAPDGPLSQALTSPLALTLVRDTYHGEDIRELLQYCDTLHSMPAGLAAEAITGHLLDRVLPAAYTPRPGQPLPYDLATAQRALTMIAARMNQDGTRDLNWWQISAWAPRLPRITASAIAFGLVFGFAFWLAGGLAGGLAFGLVFGLVGGFAAGSREGPHVIGHLRLTKALTRSELMGVLAVALAAGLGDGFAGERMYGLAARLAAGLAFGLAVGLVGVFRFNHALDAAPDGSGTLNPATSWRSTRRYGLAAGLAAGLGIGLMLGLASVFDPGFAGGLTDKLVSGLGGLLVFGLVFGLAFGLRGTATYPVSLACVQLAIKWRTPVQLMRFLNDAYSRNVLRAVGPSYQFRHARLQDQLAAAVGPPAAQTAPAPAGTADSPAHPAKPALPSPMNLG